jgi:hypothetical protein
MRAKLMRMEPYSRVQCNIAIPVEPGMQVISSGLAATLVLCSLQVPALAAPSTPVVLDA